MPPQYTRNIKLASIHEMRKLARVGKATCPQCKRKGRFVYYIDVEKQELFPEQYGRCDRENHCGYHLHPGCGNDRRFGQPEYRNIKQKVEIPTSYHDPMLVEKSFHDYDENFFVQGLRNFLTEDVGEEKIDWLIEEYRIGTSKVFPGATVFWQIDEDNKVHAGKIMVYNANTLRRSKTFGNKTTWMHYVLEDRHKFNLQQCFFGQHLFAKYPEKRINVVESEKTAVICAAYMPEFLWVATGGSHGTQISTLSQWREVVLYPDLGQFEHWKKFGLPMSRCMERRATEEERAAGWDLADYLLKNKKPLQKP